MAKAKKCAIGSFNTPNFESLKAVISAAEDLNQPVIIMHAQVHEEMGLCDIDEIAPIMLFMADRASVPVCVHLDHGTDLAYIKKGLDLGFTSVMHGGSGVSHADYKKVIELGIRKINYYTYMAKAGGEAVSGKKYKQFHDTVNDAIAAMRNNVKATIDIFSKKA